jgi:hypothetical protein
MNASMPAPRAWRICRRMTLSLVESYSSVGKSLVFCQFPVVHQP